MDSMDDYMYDNVNDKYYNDHNSDYECKTCNYTPLIVIICVVTFIYTAPCLLIWVGRIFAYLNNANEDTNNDLDINGNLEVINLDYNRHYTRDNVNRGQPLPKYQCSSQLSENDIFFTLPPMYSEEIHANNNHIINSESENSNSETSDSEIIDIISDSDIEN